MPSMLVRCTSGLRPATTCAWTFACACHVHVHVLEPAFMCPSHALPPYAPVSMSGPRVAHLLTYFLPRRETSAMSIVGESIPPVMVPHSRCVISARSPPQ